MASIGLNTAFPIYNADGTTFHDLVLKKTVVDSVVMSLSDKITGEVYYKDASLQFTMNEYILYRRNEDEDYVKYFLVNPPTLTKEGMVADNSELKGLAKYSFEFYHPMAMLANFPFTDVAVSSNEKKYLSESKEFSWIGYPADYMAKLNKNLEGTEWVVVMSDRFPEGLRNQLSEVLKFDKETIADAVKKFYDIWGVPYVIDTLHENEYFNDNNVDYYSVAGGSKRFVIVLGLPSNEILVEVENQEVPFVFQFGKGVGLKNNSRTPRNNKIITRIAGYGSENNIPFGYPQIIWYGDSRWEYTAYQGTVTYDQDGKVTNEPAAGAYPLYKGIVGGQYVTLIKHPFTRSHLMPSIYSESVFNKVSPYLSDGTANPNYNRDLQLIDFYDAVSDNEIEYPNEINAGTPSYEIHEFYVKPELRDGEEKTFSAVTPINNDLTDADDWNDAIDDDGYFEQSYFKVTIPALGFDLYACAAITEEMQINMRSGACIGCTFPVQVDWEDYKRNFYNEDGEFDPVIGEGHPRSATKYPDSTSSAITLILQKENTTFGTIMPNIYQKPAMGDAFVILGISLPLSYITNAEHRLDDEMKSYMLENNVYYYDYPLKFDEHFLTTHSNILSQITTNTIIRFAFEGESEPLELYVKQLTIKYNDGVLPKYDITLTDNIEVVLNQIGRVADSVEKLGALIAVIRQNYNRSVWVELDKKLSKAKDDYTPYKLRMGEMQVDGEAHIGGDTIIEGSVGVGGDVAIGGDTEIIGDAEIHGDTQQMGDLTFGSKDVEDDSHYSEGIKGCRIFWNGSGWFIETDYLAINKKMYAKSIQVDEVVHVGGENLLTDASCIADHVVANNSGRYYRVFFRKKNGEGRTIYNKFRKGDQAYCQIFNIDAGTTQDFTNRYYWRLVVNTSNIEQNYVGNDEFHFIDLSMDYMDSSGDIRMDSDASSIPSADDHIVQLGYRPTMDVSPNPLSSNDIAERQGATLISGGGKWKRAIVMWEGIKTFHLPEPKIKISPNEVNLVVDSLKIRTSGAGGTTDQSIEQYVDTNRSQFIIFETESTDVPTLSNAPYTSWSADEKELYSTEPNNAVILNSDGRTWRFVKNGNTYAFEEFTDPWLLAQHEKIENILDEDVITNNEVTELKRIKDELSKEATEINNEYNGYSQEAKTALSTAYTLYSNANTALVTALTEIIALSTPIKLKKNANDTSADYAKTRAEIRGLFSDNAQYHQAWLFAVRSYFSNKLEATIDNMLDDAVITADEIKTLTILKNQIDDEYTRASSEFATTQDANNNNASPLQSRWNTYLAAYNTIRKPNTPNKGYLTEILEATPPIYLNDYSGSGVTKYRASRTNLFTAISNYKNQLDNWNKAYDEWKNKKYVAEEIEAITGSTIDASLSDLLEDYAALVTGGNYSSLEALDDQLKAITNWVTPDGGSIGQTGLVTYLQNLFVGTGVINLQKDGNGNVLYFDTADRRIYSDSNGIYYLNGSTKVYYKDTDPSAVGKTPAQYGKPHVENINKSGLVTSTAFAALVATLDDGHGNPISASTIATWISTSFDSQTNANKIKSHINITADDVKIQSGSKDLGDFFSLVGGNLWCQNLTVEGVYNNLITEIDWVNNKRRDLIIRGIYDDNGFSGDITLWTYVGYIEPDGTQVMLDQNYSQIGSLHTRYFLDVLQCGDVLVIKTLPPEMANASNSAVVNLELPFFEPFFSADSNGHTTDECRGLTLFAGGNDGAPRLMTANELRMLVGKRMAVKWEVEDNQGTLNWHYTYLSKTKTPEVYCGSYTPAHTGIKTDWGQTSVSNFNDAMTQIEGELSKAFSGVWRNEASIKSLHDKDLHFISTRNTINNKTYCFELTQAVFIEFTMVKFHNAQKVGDQPSASYKWGYVWFGDEDVSDSYFDADYSLDNAWEDQEEGE